ncbi:MAG: hypothetical protein AB7W16_12535 [Candidatus Obscuribacterales bacterium]
MGDESSLESLLRRRIEESESGELKLPVAFIEEIFPERILSAQDSSVLLSMLHRTIDTSTTVLSPGYVPGSRTIGGSVNGDRFVLKKNGFFVSPFTREINGRVVPQKGGSIVEYRLAHQPVLVTVASLVTLSLVGATALAAWGLYTGIVSHAYFIYNASAFFAACFWVILPLIILFVLAVFFKLGCHSSYGDEEALLDHLRKTAAGIETLS